MGGCNSNLITRKGKNVKGQIRVGNVVIAFIIMGFIMLGAFTLYVNFLEENNVTADKALQADINALYASTSSNAEAIQDDSEEVSTQFDSGDNIFIRGSKVLDSVGNTGKLAISGVQIAQNATGDTQLPKEFWSTLITIITIIGVLAVAGALWKWDFI